MPIRIAVRIAAAALVLLLPAAWGQTDKKLSARELFYAPPAKAAPAKPKAQAAVKSTKQVVAKKAGPEADKAVQSAAHSPASSHVPAGQRQSEAPEGYMTVAYSGQSAIPLGLRYSLLKRDSDGQFREVSADSVFRAGDRLRVNVESNDNAYLYIVQRGSSGSWNLLFPSAEVAGGDNRVQPGRGYLLPPGGQWTFDEQAGSEKIFIVLTRRPEPSLENLIYSLSSGKPSRSEPAPSVDQPGARPAKMMIASNIRPIDDSLIGGLRNQMLARDLVFEKVDDSRPASGAASTAPGGRVEKAVYVVNPSRDPDARLVADVTLEHR